MLYGEAGNDTLQGGAGDDWLEGGAGNDSLWGGDGSDTYVFGRGDGQDLIYNDSNQTGTNAIRIDRLLFKEGLTRDDIEYVRSGSNLIFSIKGSTDTVTVSGWFSTYRNDKLSSVEFSDGSKLDLVQLELDVLKGTAGNDTLRGTAKDDEMFGYAGDDILYGDAGVDKLFGGAGADQLYAESGNDVLYGEAGNDTLQGGAGDDWIDGGAGNDSLMGGDGSDTYVFGRGDGQDSINNSALAAGVDRLLFKDGITRDDIEYFRNGGSLVFRIKETGDTINIMNWFSSMAQYKLSSIEFSDGSKLDINVITVNAQSRNDLFKSELSMERNIFKLIDAMNHFSNGEDDSVEFSGNYYPQNSVEVYQY